jgi:hypothetical protein
MKSKIVSETGLVHTGVGYLGDIVINSHTSGTIKLIDGTENSVVATGTLTSTGACVPASHGQNVLTSTGAMVAGTHAVSVLTGDAVVEGNVVVAGAITYTAKRVPTLPYHVALGVDTETFLVNLKAAINGTATSVQAYEGTTAHPQIVAVASDATTLTVRGRVPGTSLNAVATTGTALRTVWADTTLGGGTGASDAGVTTAAATATLGAITYTVVDALSETYGATAIPYQVLKGASEATMLDNLKLAVNGTGTAGTEYSTGTVAHAQLIATTNTDTAQTVVSRTIGNAAATAVINALATTETMANTSWADTTFGGGTGASNPAVTSDAALITIGNKTYTATLELSETSGATAVANQVLWVTSEAVFLDNLKLAINETGIAGTNYSTGTTQHTQVLATTNANDSQVVQSRSLGSAQNSIATTETLANYAWGAATLTGGTGATGRVLFDTITFSVAATTGERWIDLGDAEFYTGLFAVIGGTANTTITYNHN